MERALSRDPGIMARTAGMAYHRSRATSETRWGPTAFEAGTVNLGVDEWELTASQPFELGSRARMRSAMATAEGRAMEAESLVRQAEVSAITARLFFEIQLCQRSQDLLDSLEGKTGALLKWQTRGVNDGALDPLDTLRTQNVLQQLAAEREEWENRLRSATDILELLLDTSFAPNERFVGSWPIPTEPAPLDTTEKNLRIHAAHATRDIADVEFELQKADGTPELSVTAGISGSGGNSDMGGILGVGISLPLFTGSKTRVLAAQAQRTSAHAQMQSLAQEEKANLLRLYGELKGAFLEFNSVTHRILPLERALLDTYHMRYRKGILPFPALWEQIDSVIRLELRQLASIARYASATTERTLFSEKKQ